MAYGTFPWNDYQSVFIAHNKKTAKRLRATFMKELGHSQELGHGGPLGVSGPDILNKPHHLSVMNKIYVNNGGDLTRDIPFFPLDKDGILDYQITKIVSLVLKIVGN